MIGKIACLLAFMVALVVVTNAVPGNYNERYVSNNRSHNLIVGYHRPGDRLVLKQQVFRKAQYNQVITVQQTFNVSKYERITVVRALDQMTNGLGAYPSLLNGGPGASNVTLRFQSLKGQPINFFVEIYSKP